MVLVDNLFYMTEDFFGFWAYIFVGAFLVLESFPFIGAFIPGGIIGLLACGFLVKLGYFVFWKIGIICVLALVAVDLLGYWLGSCRREGFLCRRSGIFLVKKDTVEKVRRIVHGHLGKSLILGKVNPVTRSIAPFIVGNERVSFGKFLFFSVLGSVLFVGSFLFLGFVLGNSYEVVAVAERYILWVGGVLLGGFYVYWLGNLFREFFFNKVKNK